MKVIVFGGAGYLGSHVADGLSAAGHEVVVFDLKPSPFIGESQKMLVGDILDAESVQKAVKGCDAVYNFAGLADIDEARHKPVETVRTNVLGNAIILEACVKHRIKRYLFASTVYVYSSAGSFYGASKKACESYIECFQKAYGLDYTILRYGSLYGGRAGPTNAIRRLLIEALKEKHITYWGDGEEIREYVHVEDAARCSVEALAAEFVNENLIITGHQSMRVKDLLVMIQEMLGRSVAIAYAPDESPNRETHYRVTPYSFAPKLGRKLVGRHFIDMGQGLLRCMEEIHHELEAPAPPRPAPRRAKRS